MEFVSSGVCLSGVCLSGVCHGALIKQNKFKGKNWKGKGKRKKERKEKMGNREGKRGRGKGMYFKLHFWILRLVESKRKYQNSKTFPPFMFEGFEIQSLSGNFFRSKFQD